MTHEPDTAVRRRRDGSIDTDFYACRAVHMRNEARRNAPARWLRRLSGLAGKAGSAAGLLLAGFLSRPRRDAIR